MSQPVEFESLPFGSRFKIGLVRLSSPKSLNALSMDMIALIKLQLELWREDPYVAAIWIEGDGKKGFCAGGNVVDVYRSLADNQDGGAFSYRYFHTEYQLDYLISTYPKPVVCWGHGYVMGGGMGLLMAADYRIVTPSSRLSMPEIKIGLYPDVGASHFLNLLPEHYARFLALTAYQVNATDGELFQQNLAILSAGLEVSDPTPTVNTDGTADFFYTVTLRNNGSGIATDVQYVDAFDHLFSNGIPINTLNVVTLSGSLTANDDPTSGFDGGSGLAGTSTNLLDPGQNMAPGETASFRIELNVGPTSNQTTRNTQTSIFIQVHPCI